MGKYDLNLALTYEVGTERHKCCYCGRWCKLGRLTEKTPLARCEMPFAAMCVECFGMARQPENDEKES